MCANQNKYQKYRLFITYKNAGTLVFKNDEEEVLKADVKSIYTALMSDDKAVRLNTGVISLEGFHCADIDINPFWKAQEAIERERSKSE